MPWRDQHNARQCVVCERVLGSGTVQLAELNRIVGTLWGLDQFAALRADFSIS
jgi:hypothetical protein